MASSITITVNNDKSGNERQSFKNTRKTTTYMLRFVLKEKHGKTYAALVFLSSLLNVLPAIVYTMFPGMIINELTGERRIYILIFYICILILTPVVYQIINRFIRRKIENINFDKVNQILFFDIINNNQSLTLNIKYNLINSKGFDYIKNYKNSKLDKNKFMVFSAIEKLKYFPISVININSVINIFFEN